MEGSSLLNSLWYSSARPNYSMSHPKFDINLQRSSFYSSSRVVKYRSLFFIPKSLPKSNINKNSAPQTSYRRSLGTCAFELQRDKSCYFLSTISPREMLPKIDKSGRFCSPRAARELALSMIYAACLEGSDPLRLFEKHINARREPGHEFDKDKLLEYNHMSFGGPSVTVESVDEANELLRNNEKESAIEAEVLAAPLKLVYSKLILRFTRKLLAAVVDSWDSHVLVINKVTPAIWKNEPAGRIVEFSILHLAMSEMAVLGTRHQIVIDEAVDLAKRFCDGAAPRIINGCLRTFVKELELTRSAKASESKQLRV